MLALRLLGALWLAPVALPIWLLYILPFWALGFITPVDAFREGWSVLFVAHVGRAKWWGNLWARWGGHTMPFAIVLRADEHERPELIAHERRHELQWFVLGPLFPIVYGLLFALYGYAANPLERDARKNPVHS